MKMTKIITAINNPELNKELKRENNIELMCKDIQYKEGILEMLEENVTVDYIIIDEKLPVEINIEELIEKIIEINEKIKIIIAIKKENKKNNNKTKLITGGKTPCGACVRRTEHISRRQLKQ